MKEAWLTSKDYHSLVYSLLSVSSPITMNCTIQLILDSGSAPELLPSPSLASSSSFLLLASCLFCDGCLSSCIFHLEVSTVLKCACDCHTNLYFIVTAAAEGAGKLILNQGLTSSFRPRKYYTLPKETVEGILEDLEQLADFFLIEFQRILFAENVLHTAAVSTFSTEIGEQRMK